LRSEAVPANLEISLDLPEVRIVKTEMSQHEIVISVESTREWGRSAHDAEMKPAIPGSMKGAVKRKNFPCSGSRNFSDRQPRGIKDN